MELKVKAKLDPGYAQMALVCREMKNGAEGVAE